MAETRSCPSCGAELPSGAPEGLCPRCLLRQGLEGHSSIASSGVANAPDQARTSPYYGGRFVPPTPADLAPLFPQLEILELLGQGGMGAVYKARQPRLDRLVAIKILPREPSQDPAFAERFSREARVLARLSHPHIVGIYDIGEAAGLFFFVMEYVDGLNLRQMQRAGELAPREALAIVPQICDALQYAHDEGVVHRDIKPENILIDKRGRVKIADFGLAKLLGVTADFTLTGTQQVMGTPQYMAPEQIESPQQVDHRADIYSLGVVFYEMLTGELPIGRFEPPSHRVQVDVRLDEVVLKSLEKRPERRYQHASDVKTDVQAVSDGPSHAHMVSNVPRPPKQPRAIDTVIQRRVRVPAIGLIAAGTIDCSTPIVLGVLLPVLLSKLLGPTRGGIGFAELMLLMIWPILGVVRIIGGLTLLTLRGRRFSQAVAAVSLLPLSPGFIIGLPMGIWALVVLRKQEVKEVFGRANQRSPSQPTAEASDPEEKVRSAELAERPPGWLGFAAWAAFGLGWIFVGAMWNFRMPGLVVGFGVLAAITYAMIRLQLVYLPKLRAELARQSAFRRGLALAWGAVLLALGMWFIFCVGVTFWDLFDSLGQDWMRSLPSDASGKDAIARFSLDKLASLRQATATDLFVHFGTSSYGSVMLKSRTVTLVLFALLATTCVVGAVQAVIDTRRYRGTWRNHVAPSLNTALLLMSALMIVYVAPMAPGFTMTNFPLREIRSSATSGQLEIAVDTWAQRTGYTVRSVRTWRIGNRKSDDIGQVRMLELSAPSPFDRRRVAGRFVVRPLPTLHIKCVSVDEPAETHVSIDLPQISKDSQEEFLWPALLDSLEKALAVAKQNPPGAEESAFRPDLDGRRVDGTQNIPVHLEGCVPSGFRFALVCRFDLIGLEDTAARLS